MGYYNRDEVHKDNEGRYVVSIGRYSYEFRLQFEGRIADLIHRLKEIDDKTINGRIASEYEDGYYGENGRTIYYVEGDRLATDKEIKAYEKKLEKEKEAEKKRKVKEREQKKKKEEKDALTAAKRKEKEEKNALKIIKRTHPELFKAIQEKSTTKCGAYQNEMFCIREQGHKGDCEYDVSQMPPGAEL